MGRFLVLWLGPEPRPYSETDHGELDAHQPDHSPGGAAAFIGGQRLDRGSAEVGHALDRAQVIGNPAARNGEFRAAHAPGSIRARGTISPLLGHCRVCRLLSCKAARVPVLSAGLLENAVNECIPFTRAMAAAAFALRASMPVDGPYSVQLALQQHSPFVEFCKRLGGCGLRKTIAALEKARGVIAEDLAGSKDPPGDK